MRPSPHPALADLDLKAQPRVGSCQGSELQALRCLLPRSGGLPPPTLTTGQGLGARVHWGTGQAGAATWRPQLWRAVSGTQDPWQKRDSPGVKGAMGPPAGVSRPQRLDARETPWESPRRQIGTSRPPQTGRHSDGPRNRPGHGENPLPVPAPSLMVDPETAICPLRQGRVVPS